MLQLYRNVKADVEAELTDTQRASFQEQMAEIEKQATADNPTGSRQGPGVAIVDRLRTGVEKLDLSADQQPKVKALFDDLRVKVQAMIEKARESETDPEIIRGEVRAILEDGRAQLAEILTPEQLGQLREHMSQGQGRERAESRERGPRDGELGPREGKRGPREGERGPREGKRGPRD
jgi:Spy/CpxP family protein refolding chaperone